MKQLADMDVSELIADPSFGNALDMQEAAIVEAAAREVRQRRAADTEYFFLNFELAGVGSCRRGPWFWNEAMTHYVALLNADTSIFDVRLESTWSVFESAREALS